MQKYFTIAVWQSCKYAPVPTGEMTKIECSEDFHILFLPLFERLL